MATDDIKGAIEAIAKRADFYELSRNYYYGRQRAMFMSKEYRDNYAWLYHGLRCNMCKRVVDAMVDRLTVKGFGIERDDALAVPRAVKPPMSMTMNNGRVPYSQEPGHFEGMPVQEQEQQDPLTQAPPDPLKEDIDRIWKRNRMDQRAGEVHQEASMAGDAYVVVWPSPDDPAQPLIYPNRGELMTVKYDEETPGRILWAAKCWLTSDGFTRLTLYYPDRLERWISKAKRTGGEGATLTASNASAFKPYTTDTLLPKEDNPYGVVPVFHFANNAGVGMMGHSELNDVVPLQDILNKSMMDVAVSMEFNAYKQRYAIGLDVDINPVTGKPIFPFAPGREHMFSVPSTEVKFGEFSAEDPTPLDGISMSILRKIALVSGTPLHYFNLNSGDFPSGAALRTAEAPFIAKIKDRQVSWGNVWEDVMQFALRVAGAGIGDQEDVRLSTEWEDAAPTSELELANTLTVQDKLKNNPVMMERMGFTEEDIRRMKAAAPPPPALTAGAGTGGLSTPNTRDVGKVHTPVQDKQDEEVLYSEERVVQ